MAIHGFMVFLDFLRLDGIWIRFCARGPCFTSGDSLHQECGTRYPVPGTRRYLVTAAMSLVCVAYHQVGTRVGSESVGAGVTNTERRSTLEPNCNHSTNPQLHALNEAASAKQCYIC